MNKAALHVSESLKRTGLKVIFCRLDYTGHAVWDCVQPTRVCHYFLAKSYHVCVFSCFYVCNYIFVLSIQGLPISVWSLWPQIHPRQAPVVSPGMEEEAGLQLSSAIQKWRQCVSWSRDTVSLRPSCYDRQMSWRTSYYNRTEPILNTHCLNTYPRPSSDPRHWGKPSGS